MESVKENGWLWPVACREGGRELRHGRVELGPPGLLDQFRLGRKGQKSLHC